MKANLKVYVRAAVLSVAASLALSSAVAAATEMTGAGATFPYPVYAKWAEAYKATTGVSLNYQSIGSGGGIKQIKAKTVDFGASDMPLEAKELEDGGLVQWPMIMGGVVPVVNLPGIAPGQMKLTGSLLADIFLGKVAKWNDPAIAKLNPDLKLPDQAIAVVHRSDGSGTTFLFTNYLSQVNDDWKTKVGVNTSVEWPVGLGGKGNEGVASFTGQTAGAIGYVEYAYALQNKLTFTELANHDGAFVKPESKTFQSAAANADWQHAPGFHVVLTNQPGKESWPITGASFILLHKEQGTPAQAQEVFKFFDWAYRNGGKAAEELDYVPMPSSVVALVEGVWSKDVKATDGKTIWPVK
jgi:phosphate transport system substrate-binding protein